MNDMLGGRMVEAKRRLAVSAVPTPIDGGLEKHAHLIDVIAANRDDPAAWGVYADLLESEGHPRGELMSVMIERERTPTTRLFDTQRRQLSAHASLLQPSVLPPSVVVGWRRGFANELRLDAPEQLALAQSDRSLCFVERATLVIDVASWAEWRIALHATKLPWRHVRVELSGDGELELGVLIACCSHIETLRVATRDVAAIEVDHTDANVVRPRELDELRQSLVPETEEDEDEDEDDEDGDEYRPPVNVFVAVGAQVDAALLVRLTASLSIAHLSARVAGLRGSPRPVTLIQLYGTFETELMPYGFAVALRNVLEAPIALVETTNDESRILVLSDKDTRARQSNRNEGVRTAIDLAIGQDLGAHVLEEILEQLAAAEIECLAGTGGRELLTMIDPSTQPLSHDPEVDGDSDEHDYDDEDNDNEYDEWDPEDDVMYARDGSYASAYEAPPPPPTPQVVVTATEEIVIEEPEFDEPVEVEEALTEQPEREDHWIEFEDHWIDRAIAVDDEEAEMRWPDPGREVDDPEVIARQVAELECMRHRRALEYCKECSDPHCVECGGEDYCAPCFAKLIETTGVPSEPRTASPDSPASD